MVSHLSVSLDIIIAAAGFIMPPYIMTAVNAPNTARDALVRRSQPFLNRTPARKPMITVFLSAHFNHSFESKPNIPYFVLIRLSFSRKGCASIIKKMILDTAYITINDRLDATFTR